MFYSNINIEALKTLVAQGYVTIRLGDEFVPVTTLDDARNKYREHLLNTPKHKVHYQDGMLFMKKLDIAYFTSDGKIWSGQKKEKLKAKKEEPILKHEPA